MAAFKIDWACTTTPALTVRAHWGFLHLLAECTGPSIIGFTVEYVLCDLIPNNCLAELVNVGIGTFEVGSTVNFVHMGEEIFQDLH